MSQKLSFGKSEIAELHAGSQEVVLTALMYYNSIGADAHIGAGKKKGEPEESSRLIPIACGEFHAACA